MKNLKNKKGISLIVLILTIIVMIVLATAIILSLNNSGIIGKANKAKQDSDTASLKEFANVLEAEWEMMDTSEKATTNCSSSIEYINSKFKEKGYDDKTYSSEGEIYSDLPDIAQDALSKGLKLGDEVKYTISEADKKEYTPDSSKTGATNSKLETQTDLKWIYIGISKKGELLITPDVSISTLANSDVTLAGEAGCLTGPEELNTICDKLYTVSGKELARSMDKNDCESLNTSGNLDLILPGGHHAYWLANCNFTGSLGIMWVASSAEYGGYRPGPLIWEYDHGSEVTIPIQPVVSLQSKIQNNGTTEYGVWEFVS